MTRKVTLWAALVPIVGIIAGALFSSSSHAAQGTDLRSATADLPDLIRKQTTTNRARTDQLADVQAQVDALQKQNAPYDAALKKLQSRADRLTAPAGRTEVRGPGVTVTLDDSPLRGDAIPEGMTADDVVVHQQDVQAVVNALWRGGAEAMMLMDQRVISTSAVRCVGNTLILQGRVYSPPFTIAAIGDTGQLQEALAADPTVQIYQEYVQAVQLGWDVKTSSKLTFPAYSGSIRMQYATAVG